MEKSATEQRNSMPNFIYEPTGSWATTPRNTIRSSMSSRDNKISKGKNPNDSTDLF